MTERARFVLEWEREQEVGDRVNMAALCRAFGIERQTGYKWVGRYLRGGRRVAALEDLSTRPKNSPSRTDARMEAALLRARARFPRWGARKLRDWILRDGWKRLWIKKSDVPVASTIGAVLRRHGLTRPRKTRRRTPPYLLPFRECDSPNAVWCVDFKGWFRTANNKICYPLTIMDAYSRKLLRCTVVRTQDYECSRPIFESAFLEFGLPAGIRSDNGPPFATKGLGGLSELSVWWTQLRIRHERITPGKPQENGRHERMHRTLKDETTNPPARTLRAQQVLFDQFRASYNSERPHESLAGKVPDDWYKRSTREWPEQVEPFEYPYDCDVRRVATTGTVKIRNATVRIGRAFAGQELGFRWLSERNWEVLYGPMTLGILDLLQNRVVGPRRKRAGTQPAKENIW